MYNTKELPSKDKIKSLAEECNLNLVVSALLILRGIDTKEKVNIFINPDLNLLHDPFLLSDMDKAVLILNTALKEKKSVIIFGDYDVDGITSTAIIYKTLKSLNFNVSWKLPDRLNAGYDISETIIKEIISEGFKVLITCDCGSNAIEAIDLAVSNGMEVIITDHHKIIAEEAKSHALINPHRDNSNYPFKYLCGAGVAFKTMHAFVLSLGLEKSSFVQSALDLVCLGTIADVVPLVDENRIFVVNGLKSILTSRHTGLKYLIDKNNITKDNISSLFLSLRVIPKLNSASRMGEVNKAFELLVERDESRLTQIINSIDELNNMRISEEEIIFSEAESQLNKDNLSDYHIIVVSGNWKHSIVGNVASKLSRRYKKPAIVIGAKDKNNLSIGSCRDYGNIDILSLIKEASHHLERFGGHKSAAGLTIPIENIDNFRQDLHDLYSSKYTLESDKISLYEADLSIKIDAINLDLIKSLNILEPFGECNEKPKFISKSVKINQIMRMGKEKEHLKITIEKSNEDLLDAVFWGQGDLADDFSIGALIDMIYSLEINTWGHATRPQLLLHDVKLSK